MFRYKKDLAEIARTYPQTNSHYHYGYYLIKFQYQSSVVTLRSPLFPLGGDAHHVDLENSERPGS
jgi:hypothetical protein